MSNPTSHSLVSKLHFIPATPEEDLHNIIGYITFLYEGLRTGLLVVQRCNGEIVPVIPDRIPMPGLQDKTAPADTFREVADDRISIRYEHREPLVRAIRADPVYISAIVPYLGK